MVSEDGKRVQRFHRGDVRLLYDKLILWQVLLLYMVIVYFPFLGLHSLAYIRPHLVHVIDSFIIYKDSSLSSWYQSRFSEFYPMLSQSRHYSHRIAYFSDEHHRLLLISYLHKLKTEVTGYSEVDLVETIIPVCSRSSEKLSRAITHCLKSARCPTGHQHQSASDPRAHMHFTRHQPVGLMSVPRQP